MEEIKEDDCWEISTKFGPFRLAGATKKEADEIRNEVMKKFIQMRSQGQEQDNIDNETQKMIRSIELQYIARQRKRIIAEIVK